MYQVDSEDANFLFLERTESPTHISLIALYDQPRREEGGLRFTHVRQHIGNRLNSAPVFQQKIRFTPGNIDYPYWVDDEQFDLDFHVRHLALPKPGDWRQFCIQVARLHSRPLDISRPLWEMYVIEGLDHMAGFPPHCFALYFKVHHCAMDEFTAQELLQSLHEQTPNPRQHESSAQHIAHLPAVAPSPLEMVMRGLLNNSVRTSRLILQSANNLPTLSKILTRLSIRAAGRAIGGDSLSDAPHTRFAMPLTSSRVFEGGFYSRQTLDRYAALVTGATLTHAVLAICSEAVRLYLERHGEWEGAPLTALLAVNVRNAGAHALAGNRLAINQVELHTPVEYPEGRLQAICATQPELRSTESAELTSFRLRSLYEYLPAPLLAWLSRNANRQNSLNRTVMQGGNFGLSELRGSRKPLYLIGARLLGFTGISPLYSGCGLMFSASTYCDTVGLTFTSGRNMMPDPEEMRACLDEAVRRVERYLGPGSRPKPEMKSKARPKPKSRRAPKQGGKKAGSRATAVGQFGAKP